VQHGPGARTGHYSGPLRLAEKELAVKYGTGKTIFIEHCSDLFAEGVEDDWIYKILGHCEGWPENEYVFQTKNPGRAGQYVFPGGSTVGITLESDIMSVGKAPSVRERIEDWSNFGYGAAQRFITVEPIMRFSRGFARTLILMAPDFVNVGADSKRCGLPEPSGEDVLCLVGELVAAGIEVRGKSNLERLTGSL